MDYFFSRSGLVFTVAGLLRLVLLVWGKYQDTYSPLKYTDIDYLVFTDASRYISRGSSPYERETYRYTPLLAWLLYPTSWGGVWFDFGKVIFSAGDLITGWLIFRILSSPSSVRGSGRGPLAKDRALKYASIWLLNPMVANISTRGSSEGLLAALVVALLWSVGKGHIRVAGILLGLGVHFKIYPFIYAVSIFWWLDGAKARSGNVDRKSHAGPRFLNRQRFQLATFSFVSFMGLNLLMAKL